LTSAAARPILGPAAGAIEEDAMPLAYALIHREAGISGVSFPDFPGVVATGGTAEEAIRKASEALSFHVAGMVEDGDTLPARRSLEELEADPAFPEDAEGSVLARVPFALPVEGRPAR
jgi:predicted RNase H-like HicB family nuclease